MAYASENFMNGIHEKSKFKNSQNQLNSGSSNIGTYGNLGLSALGLLYNIFGNERANRQQEYWNRLAQSNFENQFQIASADLQKAGFNPSAILGGASQNSAPSGSVASHNPVDVPSLISAVTESKLANSQIELNRSLAEKNRVEAEHTSSDFGWRTSEREASQEFTSTENQKQRDFEYKNAERQRLFMKWQTEYDAWWKQNESILERNLQREFYNASVKQRQAFSRADYNADLAKMQIAHDYKIVETKVDATMHYVTNQLLQDREFIHKFALAQDDHKHQEEMLQRWFENRFALGERENDYRRSSDFRRGVLNMANSIISLGASGNLSFENESNPIGFKW